MYIKLLLLLAYFSNVTCRWHGRTTGWKREFYITWKPRQGWHSFEDNMGQSERNFIGNASEELARDAKLKFRQTTGPRKQHELMMAYHIGLIIGKVREKYRNMLDIYREGQDHRHERIIFNPPSYDRDMLEHYVWFFELIRRYELHIDHLINAIEDIPEVEWPGNGMGWVNKNVYSTIRPYGRRSNVKDNFAEHVQAMAAEKVKNSMRQQFLMRKMGLPENSTTAKKRFFNQWPVMDTWDDYFRDMF